MRERLRPPAQRAWPALSLLLALVAVAAACSAGSTVLQRDAVAMLINLVLVVGLYVYAGNSGILSFGHVSFMAIGAYVAALLTVPVERKEVLLPDLPEPLLNASFDPLPAALVAAAVAGLFGLVIAVPINRLTGLAASLAMFSVLLIVHVVASNWDAVTRGKGSMIGVPATITIWWALLAACVALTAAFLLQESRIGLRLRASREDEVAARSIGVSVLFERCVAFVVSAFLVGAGGFLYAQFQSSFNPDAFYLGVTFVTIAMLVIGGMGSLAGAVVGTIVVSGLTVGLRRIEDGIDLGSLTVSAPGGLAEVALAVLMLVILVFRPSGITGGRELHWPLGRWIAPRPEPVLETAAAHSLGRTQLETTAEEVER
jgi:branched-chain amino acid transport system permease protein